jgi:predicted DNA-binding transcriptional regulator AlpA
MPDLATATGDSPFLTLDELAERYQVPVATVRYWRNRKTGPKAVKIGRYVRYRIEDVLTWEREQFDDGGTPALAGAR